MDYNRNPQVISISPKNNELGVATTLDKIIIGFSMDLDQETLLGNFIVEGGGSQAPCTISYENREVTLHLAAPLKPHITYNVRIMGSTDPKVVAGICNVFGKPMVGYAQSIFTTVATITLDPPAITSPLNQTVVRTQPSLNWNPVAGAACYRLELSHSNTMVPLLWPPNQAAYLAGPIIPGVEMPDGTYYWRIRAEKANGEAGQWSEVQQFYLTRVTNAPISEEDTVAVDVVDHLAYVEPEIIEYAPKPGAVNLSTKLQTLYFHVMGIVSAADVSLEMFGESITGVETLGAGMLIGNKEIAEHGKVTGTVQVLPQTDGTTIIAFTPVVLPSV